MGGLGQSYLDKAVLLRTLDDLDHPESGLTWLSNLACYKR